MPVMSSTVPRAHRLPGDEVLACLHRIGEGVDAALQRRRVHRARVIALQRIPSHVVGGDRLGEADHWPRLLAPTKRFGRPRIEEATDAMLMIEARPFLIMPEEKRASPGTSISTFTANAWSQSFGVAEDRAVMHDAPRS